MLKKIKGYSKIMPILEETKSILSKMYGDKLVDLILYGSYARGDEYKESDIDLAIILDIEISPFKEIEKINDEIYDLDLKYNKVISIHPISKEKFYKQDYSFFKTLKKEGISLC